MTDPDTGRLGAWADLPFWTTDYPAIRDHLMRADVPVFPPPDLRFAALERCQPDDTRVVILGQDPYHSPGKADGLAFSIPDDFGGRLDSLGNIFKELHDDLNQTRLRSDLGDWVDQGVLLLNTVLTVPQGQAQGHAALGWQTLTRQVVGRLQDRPRAFVLWGKPAQGFAPPLGPGHLILRAPHPSPLSAHRGFFGSRPFSTVNDWLRQQGHAPINWTDSA